ncbi:MAG: futalosine hydrolase [Gemmatimonadetes bacterium]|nr:futalosine hydrolase [Gemmatimonadota bacterium]
MPDPLLVLTATAYEQQRLRDSLQQATTQRWGHRVWVRGMIGIRPVVLVETGIGAVNTAQALTVALQEIDPELVLQIGIGGAYLGKGLNVGDLALATEENYGDLGVITPAGWSPADEIGIPVLSTNRDYYNTYSLDPALVARGQHILEQLGECVVRGPFVTVQQCTGREDIGNELAARFNAICENMEGAAAAHVCTLYAVPFLELRAISNHVEDRNKDAWDIPRAVQRAQIAARKFVEAL